MQVASSEKINKLMPEHEVREAWKQSWQFSEAVRNKDV